LRERNLQNGFDARSLNLEGTDARCRQRAVLRIDVVSGRAADVYGTAAEVGWIQAHHRRPSRRGNRLDGIHNAVRDLIDRAAVGVGHGHIVDRNRGGSAQVVELERDRLVRNTVP
jgi:hypothetical protein